MRIGSLLLVSALTALFVSLLAGCPIYSGGSGGPVTCIGVGCPCLSDTACSTGAFCSSGRCVAGTVCTTDAQCSGGQVCSAARGGICVPGTTTCRVDADCGAGRYCSAGSCVSSRACTRDTECGTGLVCDFRGSCVATIPNSCRTSADCTGGNICVEAQCRAPSTTCQFSNQCAAGRACVNNACVLVCSVNADCVGGTTCQSSFCRPATSTSGGCSTSSECRTGEVCAGGRCLTDCVTSGSCPTGTYCAEDRVCRANWQPSASCARDADCLRGRCVDGVCRTPCTTAANPSMECMMADTQLTACRTRTGGSDLLCYTSSEGTSNCRFATDCSSASIGCVDGSCR